MKKIAQNIQNPLTAKKRVPKCVTVYDKLFKMINDNYFDEGKLPSEPILAEIMGVSRMTLRQALALLQDDGIVKNIQGKGNFIIKSIAKAKKTLESLSHPVYSSLESDIDSVDIEYKIVPSTEYTNKVLERDSMAVVFVDRLYKYNHETKAYTLSVIPIENIKKYEIDLTSRDKLLGFLEETIYEKPIHSKLKISLSNYSKFIPGDKNDKEKKLYYLLEEILYLYKGDIIVHNKHFIPVSDSNLNLYRK